MPNNPLNNQLSPQRFKSTSVKSVRPQLLGKNHSTQLLVLLVSLSLPCWGQAREDNIFPRGAKTSGNTATAHSAQSNPTHSVKKSTTPARPANPQELSLFLSAESQLSTSGQYARSDTEEFNDLTATGGFSSNRLSSSLAGLNQLALYPYLAERYYANRLDDPNIPALFSQYPSSPSIKKLYNAWMKQAFALTDYQNIIYFFDDFKANNTTRCAYRSALLETGQQQTAFANIEALWSQAHSLPTECSRVFEYWLATQSPLHKAQLYRQRVILAYQAKDFSFASTLGKYLPDYDAHILKTMIAYGRSPKKLLQSDVTDLTNNDLAKQLLATPLAQLARADSTAYAPFILQFSPQLAQQESYQQTLQQLLGYLVNKQSDLAPLVFQKITAPDPEALENITRYELGHANWSRIISLLEAQQNRSALCDYWLAVAYEQSGQSKKAQTLYKQLAKTRDYYGFLSADKLKQAYQFNPKQFIVNPTVAQAINQSGNLKRAIALRSLDRHPAAQKEIFEFNRYLQSQYQADTEAMRNHQLHLANWLSNNRFYFENIYLLGKLKAWDYLDFRFPAPYDAPVQQAAQQSSVSSDIIYAIIRQESSLNHRAYSSAKASGLMQLIPSTARAVANSLDSPELASQLFHPNSNILLGSTYLSQLFNEFNTLPYVAAAYNAGPSRVRNWREKWQSQYATNQGNSLSMAIQIETIPFNETRKYVKRILEYQQIYAQQINSSKPPRLSNWLKPPAPSTYTNAY